MSLIRIVTATLLLGVVACGSDLPTSPTPPTPAPPFQPSIEGTYKLTFTVSPSCQAIPVEMKLRTYTARIAEPGRGAVTVTLSGAAFALAGSLVPGFTGTRDGESVRFSIGSGSRMAMWEEIGQVTLAFNGAATVTIKEGTITGPFIGTVSVFANGNPFDMLGDCYDGKVEFARES